MLRTRSAVLLASVFLIGCPSNNENGNPNNIIVEGDQGNNTTPADMGMSNSGNADMTSNNNTPIDLGGMDVGLDFAVDSEGFMHGDWELQRRSDSAFIATLKLRHTEGQTNVEGTYQMDDPPAFGRLAGTQWLEDTFTSSWTIDVDGSNERFTLTDCVREDGGTAQLLCRYNNTIDANVIDANLVRQ